MLRKWSYNDVYPKPTFCREVYVNEIQAMLCRHHAAISMISAFMYEQPYFADRVARGILSRRKVRPIVGVRL